MKDRFAAALEQYAKSRGDDGEPAPGPEEQDAMTLVCEQRDAAILRVAELERDSFELRGILRAVYGAVDTRGYMTPEQQWAVQRARQLLGLCHVEQTWEDRR